MAANVSRRACAQEVAADEIVAGSAIKTWPLFAAVLRVLTQGTGKTWRTMADEVIAHRIQVDTCAMIETRTTSG